MKLDHARGLSQAFLSSRSHFSEWLLPSLKAAGENMDGKQLFDHYTSKRDYSGSFDDGYAQLLQTIHGHIMDDIFELLERAERQKKFLDVIDITEGGSILRDEILVGDIFFSTRHDNSLNY